MHFEELWEVCEKLHHSKDNVSSIISELIMKLNVYKLLDQSEMPKEELSKTKTRAMGEILLTITNLSNTDDINVFIALNEAYKYRCSEN